jgi:hypothetical protein
VPALQAHHQHHEGDDVSEDNWTRLDPALAAARMVGKKIATASYTWGDGDNDHLILSFTDGSNLTISGVWHNDSTGGLDFIEEQA